MKFPSTHNIFVNDVFDSFENTIELKAKMHKDKPGQLHLGLRVPNLSFDMLHELPHRNYNIPHLSASANMCKVQVGTKQVIQGNRNIS